MLVCPICFNLYKPSEDIVILKCGHLYHKTCVEQWFSNKPRNQKECPHCRKKVTGKFGQVFGQFDSDANFPPSPSSSTTVLSSASVSNGSNSILEKFSLLKEKFWGTKKPRDFPELTAAEKEIEDLFKKYSDKHRQLIKSQDECSTFRNLIANKDTQISSLSNDVERLGNNMRAVTFDNDRLILERGRLSEQNLALERQNEKLRRENSGLSELKALKPIGDILNKRKEEVPKRVDHFKNLATTTDEAMQLLVNYCFLVDSEVDAHKSEIRSLKRKLNRVATCTQCVSDNGCARTRSILSLPKCNGTSNRTAKNTSAKAPPRKQLAVKCAKMSAPLVPAKRARLSSESRELTYDSDQDLDQYLPLTVPVQGCSSWTNSSNGATTSQAVKDEHAIESVMDLSQDSIQSHESSSPVISSSRVESVTSEQPRTQGTSSFLIGSILDDVAEDSNSSSASSSGVSNSDSMHATTSSVSEQGDGEDTPTSTSNNGTVTVSILAVNSNSNSSDSGSISSGPLPTYEAGGVTYQVLDDEISVQKPEVIDLIEDSSDDEE